jgi:hypothetical protein
MNLDLRAPLVYNSVKMPFDSPPNLAENEEILLCFSLEPAQSQSIEPDTQRLLGPMSFAGRKTDKVDSRQAETVSLPSGNYLFTQCRSQDGRLNEAEWLDLAVEQQKDGLWERQKLENKLYVRFLYEDGGSVTQLFRPIA